MVSFEQHPTCEAASLTYAFRFRFLRRRLLMFSTLFALLAIAFMRSHKEGGQHEFVAPLTNVEAMLRYDSKETKSSLRLSDLADADYIGNVVYVRLPYYFFCSGTDADLHQLKVLFALEELDATNSGISDKNLDFLSGLQRLQRLKLQETQITDTGLSQLKELTTLQELDISESVSRTAAKAQRR